MSDESLYDRIGGAKAVEELIGEFYRHVLADPELGPFFENTSIERLERMQREFFAAALDGPPMSFDVDLATIHQDMAVTRHHLTRFVSHLIAVLESRHEIDRSDAMQIIYRIAVLSDEVIGGGVGEDG